MKTKMATIALLFALATFASAQTYPCGPGTMFPHPGAEWAKAHCRTAGDTNTTTPKTEPTSGVMVGNWTVGNLPCRPVSGAAIRTFPPNMIESQHIHPDSNPDAANHWVCTSEVAVTAADGVSLRIDVNDDPSYGISKTPDACWDQHTKKTVPCDNTHRVASVDAVQHPENYGPQITRIKLHVLSIHLRLDNGGFATMAREEQRCTKPITDSYGRTWPSSCVKVPVDNGNYLIDLTFDDGKTIHDVWRGLDRSSILAGHLARSVQKNGKEEPYPCSGCGEAVKKPSLSTTSLSEKELLDKLQASKHLTIKYSAADGGQAQAVLDLTGASEAISRLCKDNPCTFARDLQ